MKIFYITNQIINPGGLERVLSVKASYLADKFGYEVHICGINQNLANAPFYHFSDKIVMHNLNIPSKGIMFYLKFLLEIRRLYRQVNADITIICDDSIKGFMMPYILGRPKGLIFEKHASKHLYKRSDNLTFYGKIKFSILSKLMDFGAKKYDAFVVLTQTNTKEYKGLKNIHVIPNPLPFFPNKCSNLDSKIVLAVGNHGFQKGFDRLIKAWERIHSDYPKWQLHIFGRFDSEKRHVSLTEKLNLSDSIKFFEPVKDIASKYREASIYALSSRSEGFGMVLIEAMSFGVPAVAFDCPAGPRDIIEDGEDGLLVPNGEIEMFADRLSLLMKNTEYRKELGVRARISSKKYLPENICKQWVKLFHNVLDLSA